MGDTMQTKAETGYRDAEALRGSLLTRGDLRPDARAYLESLDFGMPSFGCCVYCSSLTNTHFWPELGRWSCIRCHEAGKDAEATAEETTT